MMRRKALALIVAGCLLAGGSLLGFRAAPVPSPPLDRLEYSFQLLDRVGRVLGRRLTRDGFWRLPANLDAIDSRYLDWLMACEDQRFWSHSGVDPWALVRALWQWISEGRVVSGASTLTMQTVRLLQPRPRTLVSKLVEMVQAVRLERVLDKREILELYLTLAPYGGNLQGIRAASLAYFGKEPRRLTPSEIALLIALPQSPETRRPDRHPEAARRARNFVLQRLYKKGLLDRQTLRVAQSRPVPSRGELRPFLAPHLTARLHRLHPDKNEVRTTLDARLQRRLRDLARRYRLLPGESLAVLVVENESGQVRAHLGSGDWLCQSQLDLTRAVRSPGSTLKPFIYGLGFETGKMHPETWVRDEKYRAGVFGPANYDRKFHGVVSLREALRRSLNIPAVKALRRIGVKPLLWRFNEVGVTLRLPPGQEPGLAVALGGAGIRLQDLVALYASLARGGRFRALSFEAGETHPEQKLLSPVAVWYLDNVLKEVPPPEGFANTRAIRYKTGTSYGFRDAWAIGYDARYTVGVWVGRPDGGASNGRTGANSAAPLLFTVFELLPAEEPADPEPPAGVILAGHAQLPRHLQWLSPEQRGDDRPRIVFPPDESRLPWNESSIIVLKAQGGTRPYHWVIDGEIVPGGSLSGRVQWKPKGPGQARVVLIDGQGRRARVRLWLEARQGSQ